MSILDKFEDAIVTAGTIYLAYQFGGSNLAWQVGATIASTAYQRKQQRKLKEQQKDRAATREIRVTGSNLPLPIRYGYTRTADNANVYTKVANSFVSGSLNSNEERLGNLSNFSGDKNELLVTQSVLALGPINSVVWAEVDGIDYDNDKYSNWVQVNVDKVGGSVHNSTTLGRDTSATFEDICYSTEFFRMNRDSPNYQGKPTVFYYLKGRKIKTFSGSTLSSTLSFSNNSVEVLLDYLLDTKVGPALTTSDLELSSFATAAAIASQVVKTGAPINGKMYTKQGLGSLDIIRHSFNGSIYTDQDHISNIETIMDSMPGAILLRAANGKIKLSLPDPTKSSAQSAVDITIDDSLLISDITVAQPDTNSKLNQVKVSFANSGKDFADDSFDYINTSFKEQDFNLRLSTDISYAGINNVYQASGIAHTLINESRLSLYTLQINHKGIFLEPGDVVRVNSERNSIDKYIRVTKITMKNDYSLDIEGMEYSPAVYAYDSEVVELASERTSIDFSVDAPTGLSTSIVTTNDSIVNSIKISWTDAADIQVVDYLIEAGTVVGGNTTYTNIGTVPYGVQQFIHSPNVVTTYLYRIRARTRIGRLSEWVTGGSSTVTQQQIFGGLSSTFSKFLLQFKRQPTGVTVPTSDSTNLEVFFGSTKAAYSSGVGDIPSSQWRISSSLTPTVTGATVAITPNSDYAAILATPAQTSGSTLPNTTVAITIKFNGTINSLPASSPLLTTFTKYFTLGDYVDGSIGSNGSRTALLDMYKLSTSTPTTFPSGTSTYTWATGSFTAPATPNSWSINPTAAVAGQTLWGCKVIFPDSGTTATSSITWSATSAYPVGYAGADGISITGQRGSGWFRTTEAVNQATLDGYTTATLNTKFTNLTGFAPVQYDVFIISGTAPAVKAWVFNGSTWAVQASFIDGNLLVDGTITGDKLVADTITAREISVANLSSVSADLGTVTAGNIRLPGTGTTYMIIDGANNRLDVYNAGTLKVRLGNLG